jgi:hypothetical protein
MFDQLFRNEKRTVRTYWRLFIVAFSVLLVIVLNRIILIVIGLLNDTTDSRIVLGVMDLVAVTGLMYVLTTKLDGREFSWVEIGLSWKPTVFVFFWWRCNTWRCSGTLLFGAGHRTRGY